MPRWRRALQRREARASGGRRERVPWASAARHGIGDCTDAPETERRKEACSVCRGAAWEEQLLGAGPAFVDPRQANAFVAAVRPWQAYIRGVLPEEKPALYER